MKWVAIAALIFAAPPRPPPPLPMLPSIARVKVNAVKGQLVVATEVNLPRGNYKGEPLDFYVAFGVPGTPRAIDAHLVAVADGSLEPEDADVGETLPAERAPRRPDSVSPLLGRDTMAGVVVHVKKDVMTRALAPGNMASLRIRTALDVPEDDPSGAKSVVVRLGSSGGTPLTLGRIVVDTHATRVEARLCGPEADTHPLAVTPRPSTPPSEAPIAPILAVRHATDDLCIHIW